MQGQKFSEAHPLFAAVLMISSLRAVGSSSVCRGSTQASVCVMNK